jgi:hypothetical protein
MAGAKPPDMQVGDPVVALLQPVADCPLERGVRRGVEKDGA